MRLLTKMARHSVVLPQVSRAARIMAIAVVITVSCPALQAEIIFVNDDATGLNDGTSAADAFNDLQDALSVAIAGDEIWVAAGAYTPVPPSGDRAATFQLINGVALLGGFNDTFSAQDPDTFVTILSGDLNGDDQTGGNNGENSLHVVTGSGTDETAVLDGFTITAGNADGPFPEESGAGMFTESGSPTVVNCSFTSNFAAGQGGGMRNTTNSNPAVTNCHFIGNFAFNDGGGMSNVLTSSPIVIDCIFEDNSNGGAPFPEGGGMNNSNDCAPIVIGCRFEGNSSRSGGAMFNFNSSPTIIDCTFIANSASLIGGGISNSTGSNPDILNSRFVGNSAVLRGGGLISSISQARVINSIFSGNFAGDEGAISNDASVLELINVTVVGNTVSLAFGVGGIASGGAGSSLTVTNGILFGNSSPGLGTVEPAQIVGSGIIINHSLVQGWTGSFGGVGNSGDSPLFVNSLGVDGIPGTEDDDLRLSAGSPAIDSGDNTAVPADLFDLDGDLDTTESIPIDLDGNLRFADDPATADTGVGTPPIVDRGAFEFLQPDSDGDGIPDDEDACPDSELSPTVVIDGCDSGVENMLFDDGCTMADLIAECADGASNHGGFVSCVAELTNEWKQQGIITGQEKGAIQSCAAQADLP